MRDWVARERPPEGVLVSIELDGLDSLLQGEPPNPLGAKVAGLNKGADLKEIRQNLGPLAAYRSLRFTVKDEPDCTRARVIESLRQAIPADLVEDILIGYVSWTETE
jgi:hypothetical protein